MERVSLCLLLLFTLNTVQCSVEFGTVNRTYRTLSSYDLTCPPWTYSTSNNTCQCNRDIEFLVQCNTDCVHDIVVSLPYCYCMSHNELLNITVVGYCIVRCHISLFSKARHLNQPYRYRIIASTNNVSELNDALCSDLQMNRTGQLCSKCVYGYTPPVYSYDLACVKCTSYKYNWLKYIAIAYVPLTLFYMVIVLFRISVTSPLMNVLVMTIQIFCTHNAVQMFQEKFTSQQMFLIAFYSVWNLDFFRDQYTPFCIHPSMSMLQTLALDYAIAVYPIVLILITYLLVYIHDNSTKVARLWMPFRRCLREEWNLKDSLVGVFATFILLSYVKILNTSLNLLIPVKLFSTNEHSSPPLYVGVDATLEYFGKEHRPYALLALFMVSVFNVIPLLLTCLYPCRCFHRFLNICHFHSHALSIFMDYFQGHFKTHPRDCRYFAAFYLFLRLFNLLLLCLSNGAFYFPIAGIVMMFSSLLVAVVKPYKSSIYSNTDALLLTLTGTGLLVYPLNMFVRLLNPAFYFEKFRFIIIAPLILHPTYTIIALMYLLLPKGRIKEAYNKVLTLIKQRKKINSSWMSLPDQDKQSNEEFVSISVVEMPSADYGSCE